MDSNHRLVGDNTDVPGFLQDVHQLPGLRRGKALVLGAGGSARAVVYALAREGWQVQVLSRRSSQAAEVIERLVGLDELHGCELSPGTMDDDIIRRCAEGCRLIVNATPLGMYPNMEGTPWPETVEWPRQAVVYDLVYNPAETVFTRSARQAGLPARTGGGMLSSQAALAFAHWTGLEPPFEVMYKSLT
jgi:shikimate dehydrogenase